MIILSILRLLECYDHIIASKIDTVNIFGDIFHVCVEKVKRQSAFAID